eukprot:1155042-Pelagomonas_calceolata.AAC.1
MPCIHCAWLQEIRHAGPSLTDVNPIAARMDGGRAANQPGRAQPAVQEQSPGLGPPEVCAIQEGLAYNVLQNCSNTATLCWPNAHSPPSKYAPASHAYLLVLHKGSVTHSWQEISAAMHLPPGFCQHDFDPDSDEVGPAAGGKGLYSDVVLALVPQPQQSAASSNAFHGHAALHRCSPDPPPQQFQGGHAEAQPPGSVDDNCLQREGVLAGPWQAE